MDKDLISRAQLWARMPMIPEGRMPEDVKMLLLEAQADIAHFYNALVRSEVRNEVLRAVSVALGGAVLARITKEELERALKEFPSARFMASDVFEVIHKERAANACVPPQNGHTG